MTDLRVCTKGVGFAVVATLTTVALTPASFGQGGENAGSPTPLGLNVLSTGTTVGYLDDSDEVCPYTGSTSADVYYSYVPGSSHNLTVEMCESGYDTKTYVYDSGLALITNVNGDQSCNDDACSSSGGGGFRSLLNCVPVNAGFTYYVVVDGWGGDNGPYSIELHVTETYTGNPDECAEVGPCIVVCDPTKTIEGEPCLPGGDDVTNGGCNSSPPIFSPISCGESYCGDSYFDGALRDTDWYSVTTTADCIFTWDVVAEFSGVAGRVENNGIDDYAGVTAFAEVVTGDPCDALQTVSIELGPGTYWFFVGPQFTDVFLCDASGDAIKDYNASLSCECTFPCPWDFDGSGAVGFADLLKLLSNWGPCP